MRILVVEDTARIAQAVSARLRGQGHAVDCLASGLEAREVLQYQRYDLILLDLGLPDWDGTALLNWLRKRGDKVPVLVVTARSAVSDRIAALDLGADDYLIKPFDPEELEARIRALLRRVQGEAINETRLGRLALDRAARVVRVAERRLDLPQREFRVLEILMAGTGKVLAKEEIADQLFNFDEATGLNAVEVYVGRLRRRLAEAEAGIEIRTLRGLGYLIEADPETL
ncbi:response regulator transcription factor [Algihabitans albus]|uniref:response regulator n=1 Tax=Algihabitans albus TaxID=2164067 RepID=UPI0035CF2647